MKMKDFAKSIVCNTKAEVANKEWKPGDTGKVEINRIPYKVKIISVDGPWAKIQFLEGDMKGMTDSELLTHIRTGNSKVGNSDILSGNYIILADNGEVWFRDEHENVHIRNIDSWAQKRIASYQSSIDEIKKGVAEAKQAAKKAGMI